MPFLDETENKRLGIARRKSVYPTVIFSLLESIRCHSTDEYLVYGQEEEAPVPPLACSFCRVPSLSQLLALVDENGSLVIYDTNKYGEKAVLKDWNAHSNAVFDVEWMSTEEKILTGSGDQTICLWDARTSQKLLTFRGHTSSVRSIVFRPRDDGVFASGSRDGHVRLWDHRCNIKDAQVSSVNVIRNAHAMPQQPGGKRRKSRICSSQALDSQQSVTSVVFQDDNLLATSGAVDGVVKVWDLRKVKSTAAEPSALYNFPYPGKSKKTHGYSSLMFDSTRSRLFASCTDDVIYMYDFASYNTIPVCSFHGHRNMSFYVKAVVSPDDQFLLSGSSDEHAYIWQIANPNQSPVCLKGHRSEVSDVAWCQRDIFRIVTTSDDNTMRIWRYDPTAMMRKASGQSDNSCGITGMAERTHRDIGTDVFSQVGEVRGSLSSTPVRGQKRAAPEILQPDLTPKRAKTLPSSSSSAVSPSIKHWLKCSASESTDSQAEVKTKILKLEHSGQADDTAKIEGSSRNVTEKGDATSEAMSRSQEVQNQRNVGRPSCKRKLEDSCAENDSEIPRKKTHIRKSPDKEIFKNYEKENLSPKLPSASSSCENEKVTVDNQTKLSAPLKNLNSDINSSPDKRVQDGKLEFYSPVRPSKLDLDTKTLASPTTSLPNSVLDKPASAKKCDNTETKEKKPKVDWLTQIRIQKARKQNSGPNSCSRKLSDRYSQCSDPVISSKEPMQPQGNSDDLKCKSPLPGVKTITSFFKRHTSTS